MKFLSYDSKFSQVMIRVCYACWLNLIWFVCSIPIVTVGASTTALYYVMLKLARGEEGNVTSMFFRSFKENFKQATVLWLIMLAAGIFLGLDGYILVNLRRTAAGPLAVFWTILLAVVIAAAVFYVIVLIYLFPLVASVRNTNRAMLKNSFLIGAHYLFCTILVFAIHFAVFFVTVRFFTPLLLLGEGLSAMLSSILLWRVIDACTYDPDEEDEDEEKTDDSGEEPEQ
ncbi:MAG: YesL family protein [Oscillospiraceae bacterium]|nr:YesL family protein [Oscillospiraceae bacterium]MBR7011165.1 YesL family protein [Oscillospiraceae bacterium]